MKFDYVYKGKIGRLHFFTEVPTGSIEDMEAFEKYLEAHNENSDDSSLLMELSGRPDYIPTSQSGELFNIKNQSEFSELVQAGYEVLESEQKRRTTEEEQCFCQSHYDNNETLQDCTCGSC